MYPNNQTIEVFGEQVSWPGVGANGKFTNGSFSDPMVKPSFIPAETINLILDNLESVIRKCGELPNAIDAKQIARLITHASVSQTIIMRDENGRAKVAPPEEEDDIARLAEINELRKLITSGGVVVPPPGGGSEEPGGGGSEEPGNEPDPDYIDRPLNDVPRDLMELFGVSTIPEVMQRLRRRLNNNEEIDNTGNTNFQGLMVGDYIDGLDLSGIVDISNSSTGNSAQAWNDTYKNNRIVIAGFNNYCGVGSPTNTKNHYIFSFVNCVARGRMNETQSNIGGYPASIMRQWLEGTNGDGSGPFAERLKIALGGNYLYTIRKYHIVNGNGTSSWNSYTVWPPSEFELFGTLDPLRDKTDFNTNKHLPYFQDVACRKKKWNGVGSDYWAMTRFIYDAFVSEGISFVGANSSGQMTRFIANNINGVSPVFCVA
jgi:hypothetical protein